MNFLTFQRLILLNYDGYFPYILNRIIGARYINRQLTVLLTRVSKVRKKLIEKRDKRWDTTKKIISFVIQILSQKLNSFTASHAINSQINWIQWKKFLEHPTNNGNQYKILYNNPRQYVPSVFIQQYITIIICKLINFWTKSKLCQT